MPSIFIVKFMKLKDTQVSNYCNSQCTQKKCFSSLGKLRIYKKKQHAYRVIRVHPLCILNNDLTQFCAFFW